MNERFVSKVREVAENAPVTGAWPFLYTDVFRLPKELPGVRILDVGAGMSLFSESLFQQGANPIAIDINYDNPERLLTNFNQTYLAVMEEDKGSSLEELQENYQKKVSIFTQSFVEHADMYIPASATHLPFKTDTFNLVVSLNGVFGTLDVDSELLRVSIDEAIRVVKSGGTIQLAPMGNYRSLSPSERQNQNLVIRELKRKRNLRVRESTRIFGDKKMGVLTITKS